MYMCVCFFKQSTADEMRISDWSSDVCSSDLNHSAEGAGGGAESRIRATRHQGARKRAEEFSRAGRPAVQPGGRKERGAIEGPAPAGRAIGRASCRARVRQYV